MRFEPPWHDRNPIGRRQNALAKPGRPAIIRRHIPGGRNRRPVQ